MFNLENFAQSHDKTLLCIGPLSCNLIDVSVEFANENKVPLVFVASRRQIECSELGGGYVNNWSTQQFVEYVQKKKSEYIFFERDHGGPWQGVYEVEKGLDVNESMKVAKKSYEVDIDSGFDILHIDPTIPINREVLKYETILSRLFELYGHISEYSASKNKKIFIELGTEEQNGSYTDLDKLEDFLNEVDKFAQKNKFTKPTFVVIQTGAKVVETRNIGMFERGTHHDRRHLIKNIKDSAAIADKYNLKIKEHNADYLSLDNLCLRPQIGIHAANIAPEFGHIETKSLIYLLSNFGNAYDYENYIEIVHASKKWEKWILPESNLKKSEKAILAGHYCSSDMRIEEIKNNLKKELKSKNIDMDIFIKKSLKSAIYKYAIAFGLL